MPGHENVPARENASAGRHTAISVTCPSDQERPGAQVRIALCPVGYQETDTADLPMARWHSYLDGDERMRAERYRFRRDRTNFIVARALLRLALSERAGLPPEQWRFATDAFGRPHVANTEGKTCGLHFSISHCDGLVAVAVRSGAPGCGGLIGIDVERRTDFDHLSVAERFFATAEWRWLRGLPPAEQSRGFFALWTLKESLAKALGRGLALPLDRVAFDLGDPPALRIEAADPHRSAAESVRLVQWWPDEQRAASLCCSPHDTISVWLPASPSIGAQLDMRPCYDTALDRRGHSAGAYSADAHARVFEAWQHVTCTV